MTSIRSSVAMRFIPVLFMAASAEAATLNVNSTADDGAGACSINKCTLRDAISSAGSGDTVTFALPANSTIELTKGELLLNKNLTINGPGANLLSVQRSFAPGTPAFRIFSVASGVTDISGLTIANGLSGDYGGGVFNYGGTVNITDSTIADNHAGAGWGGGVANICVKCAPGFVARMNISGSTISANSAGHGGGAYNADGGGMSITRSTISGNGGDEGGGIWLNVMVTINNSTISDNAASSGGGIYNMAGSVTARNTIIALNKATIAGPDVRNVAVQTTSATFTSQGFNLIGNSTGANITPATGDQIGVTATQLNLGPLQDNGGPTWTHALLSGSTAIERGDSGGSGSDQRGFARPVDSPAIPNAGDGSDIGAYEVQADLLPGCNTINRIVNNNNDGGTGSLRDVIATVCAGSTITFAPDVSGSIDLTTGELLINKSLMISGPGANVLTVRRGAAAGNFRIFNIASASVDVTISGLTIANGSAGPGGGISNVGALKLVNTAISGNAATVAGGGIFNNFGTLTITGSTLSGNTVNHSLIAGSGGGLFNSGGMVFITNSTISGNTANGPGGNSDSGGGIITNVGSVTLVDSTIAGNSGDIGGGIRNINGGIVTSRNTLIALNTSPNGPDVNGPLTSQGFNLVGITGGATISPAQFSDQLGITAAQLNLGPLLDNGGPTRTHALLPGSFAIDNGHSSGAATDQRGFTRPLGVVRVSGGDGADIGAFEVQGPVSVVEFYNASLDHYFITWVVEEIAKLDAGTVIKGWTRTGQAFMTYTTPQPGTSPVCRYYIPPGLGDSHFFGRGTVECNATGQKNPSFVLEASAFMQMFLPVAGECPAGTVQVYRVFSNRTDANHRYMISKAIRELMAAAGWLVEGDGPDAVVMCAPQ